MVLSVMVHQYILDKLFFYWSFGLLLLGISAARKVQPGRYGSTGESAVQCIKVPDKIKNVDTDFDQFRNQSDFKYVRQQNNEDFSFLQFSVTWPATIQDQTEHKLNDASALNFKYLINIKKVMQSTPRESDRVDLD